LIITAGSVVYYFIVGHKQKWIVQDICQALRMLFMFKRGSLFKKFKILDSSFKIYPEYSVSKDLNWEANFTRKEHENKDNHDQGENESLI
jgi:hypothetical protein